MSKVCFFSLVQLFLDNHHSNERWLIIEFFSDDASLIFFSESDFPSCPKTLLQTSTQILKFGGVKRTPMPLMLCEWPGISKTLVKTKVWQWWLMKKMEFNSHLNILNKWLWKFWIHFTKYLSWVVKVPKTLIWPYQLANKWEIISLLLRKLAVVKLYFGQNLMQK